MDLKLNEQVEQQKIMEEDAGCDLGNVKNISEKDIYEEKEEEDNRDEGYEEEKDEESDNEDE